MIKILVIVVISVILVQLVNIFIAARKFNETGIPYDSNKLGDLM